MRDFMDNLSYFLLCQKYHWKSFFVYRLQGSIWFLVGLFSVVSTYLPITIIYNVSSGIPGWSYLQLLLLANTAGFVVGSVWYFIIPWFIVKGMRTGELDKYLLRPYGKMTCILSGYGGNISGTLGILGALAIVLYVLITLNVALASIVLFFLNVIFGIFALTMLFLLITVLAYLALGSAQFTNSLLNLSWSANGYPLNIYGIGIQLFFTVFIPVGIASYYPAEMLLGKANPVFEIPILFVSIAIIIISKIGFDTFIKKYSSGGG